MILTPHFHLSEVGENAPLEWLYRYAYTAAAMEEIRALFGVPIDVTSWWRDDEHNEAVHGVPSSFHPLGYAVDFTVRGWLNAAAMAVIAANPPRLPLVRRVILDESKPHLHMEARHPERDQGLPLQLEQERNGAFSVWTP